MADLKGNMFRHLRSARQWLTRAEESFDKNSAIRGELDLLLAQAELQHARETSRSRLAWYRALPLHYAISLGLAIAVMASGAGAYWAASQHAAVPIPLAGQAPLPPAAVQTVDAVATTPVSAEDSRPVVPATGSAAVAAPIMSSVARPQSVHPIQATKENLVSADEMQKIVQAAGKSLRGQ